MISKFLIKFESIISTKIIFSFLFLSFLIPLTLLNSDFLFYSRILFFLINLLFIGELFANLYFLNPNNHSKISDSTFIFSVKNNYFKSYLIWDIISIFPFYLFSPGLIWFLPFLKIINVTKRIQNFSELAITKRAFVLVATFIFWFAQVSHWIACGWISLRNIENPNFAEMYVNAMYWTITTLTTVGYGDVVPQNMTQKIYSIFVMIAGVGFYGYLIGSFSSLLSYRDPAQKKYLSNIENLTAIVKYRNLPEELQKRIRKYFHYAWQQKLGFDEIDFVNQLPGGLKIEVLGFLRQEVLKKVEIFKGLSQDLIEELSLSLIPIVLTPGEFLFKVGDVGDKMFFITKGEIQIIKNHKIIAEIKEGNFLGEISLFKNQPRNATAKALKYCDLYYLERKSFNSIIQKDKEVYEKIENIVVNREKVL